MIHCCPFTLDPKRQKSAQMHMHNPQPIRDGRCPTIQSQIFHTLDITNAPFVLQVFRTTSGST